jgi:metallo-beta-lactamase family protein
MLGARSLRLEIDNAGENGETRSIVFSGDIGRWNQPVLRDPVTPPPADYVVVESTYGDRRHEEEEPQEKLAQVIREAHANNSPVLIPAFSVGRTQDVLYQIRELEDQGRIPIVPVRADSPMAAEATRVYHQMGEEYDDETREITAERRNPLLTRSMQFSSSREDSRRLNAETGARIIISSSGMMTGGRVMHHASQLLPDPNAVICFVGYQSEGTTGRRILNGETEVRIFKQWVPVRAKIVKIGGFSGHADCLELLGWLAPLDRQAPKRAFITHGEPNSAAALAVQIEDRFAWPVTVAAHGQTVELR